MATPTTDLSPSMTSINAVARLWTARHPEMAARIARAVALVANVRPGDRSPNVFFVEGSAGHHYMIRVNRTEKHSVCNCEDHAKRGIRCKHILACAIFERAREMDLA